jgi:hypothetical protein
MRDTVECPQVVDGGHLDVPHLVWCLASSARVEARLRMWTAVHTASLKKCPGSNFTFSIHLTMLMMLWFHRLTTRSVVVGMSQTVDARHRVRHSGA